MTYTQETERPCMPRALAHAPSPLGVPCWHTHIDTAWLAYERHEWPVTLCTDCYLWWAGSGQPRARPLTPLPAARDRALTVWAGEDDLPAPIRIP